MIKTKRRLVHFAIAVGLVALGVLGMRALTASKAELEKRRPSAQIPLVRTIAVTAGPHAVTIQGEGTVRPLQEIQLVVHGINAEQCVAPAKFASVHQGR